MYHTGLNISKVPIAVHPTNMQDCIGCPSLSHVLYFSVSTVHPIPPYQQTYGIIWDILGHPTLSPVYLSIPTVHPIPLYQQTDGIAWDVPGHPTLFHIYIMQPNTQRIKVGQPGHIAQQTYNEQPNA